MSGKQPVRMGIIGAGAVADFHHAPGIRIDPRAELTLVCDTNGELARLRAEQWGAAQGSVPLATDDPLAAATSDAVDAVIVCTPNFTHAEISAAAAGAGKHVMCEKPLGRSADEVREMVAAVEAAGVVHMTAFTYRFAPSMRYLRSLLKSGQLGEPRHFRSQRFLDWPETSWGWRQYRKTAGAGDLYDMTIHRLDFAVDLLGPIRSLCGAVARFAERTVDANGKPCPPSDVDDWSSLIAEFACGATGVWEGTTLAKGYHHGGFGHEWAEVNGSEGSAVYRLHEPNTILIGKPGGDLEPQPVPTEFLSPADSPRDPSEGDPATVFRYDLVWEFTSAIVDGRPAVPSFVDGLQAQIAADAVLTSHAERRWVDLT